VDCEPENPRLVFADENTERLHVALSGTINELPICRRLHGGWLGKRVLRDALQGRRSSLVPNPAIDGPIAGFGRCHAATGYPKMPARVTSRPPRTEVTRAGIFG